MFIVMMVNFVNRIKFGKVSTQSQITPGYHKFPRFTLEQKSITLEAFVLFIVLHLEWSPSGFQKKKSVHYLHEYNLRDKLVIINLSEF